MRSVLIACCLLAASALTGCSVIETTVIAVLAADDSARAQQPLNVERLEERVGEICDGCSLEVYDAGGDAGTQADQFDEALVAGADLVVLAPVDPEQAESLVVRAAGVPVVAYGTLVPGADWFVGLAEPAAPTTGVDSDADSDIAAAREVILKDRDSFTFVPARAMSAKAAEVVVGQLADKPVGDSTDHEGVPSWLFETVDVTVNELTSVVVADGAMTLADLCEGETAKRCSSLGLV